MCSSCCRASYDKRCSWRIKKHFPPSPRLIAVKWDGNNDTYSWQQTGRQTDIQMAQANITSARLPPPLFIDSQSHSGRNCRTARLGGCSSHSLPETSQPNLSTLGIKAPETIRLEMANSRAVCRQHNSCSRPDLSLCAGSDESTSSPHFSLSSLCFCRTCLSPNLSSFPSQSGCVQTKMPSH